MPTGMYSGSPNASTLPKHIHQVPKTNEKKSNTERKKHIKTKDIKKRPLAQPVHCKLSQGPPALPMMVVVLPVPRLAVAEETGVEALRKGRGRRWASGEKICANDKYE